MFSQASVILFTGGGWHAWQGDMHGRVCVWQGVCVAEGWHAWQGGMCGKGACVARGHAWQWGHVWQGGVHGRGVNDSGGMHGGEGACMAGEMAIAEGGTHPTGMHSC